MRRSLFFLVVPAATSVGVGVLLISACGSSSADLTPRPEPDSGARREAGLVEPLEAGASDASAPEGPAPSCVKYCDLVMETCKDPHAQYESRNQCLELCARLPSGDAGDDESNTVACRQYYADSPARTNAGSYCLAAGPFGGGICGDRCTAFCGLTLGACSPEAGPAPYGSYSDCQTACAGYPYKDGTADGGGEPTNGPTSGDTLNCRLFHVRSAVRDTSGCTNVGADSGACR